MPRSLLLLLAACPAPDPREPEECDLGVEVARVVAAWPTTAAAMAAREVYDRAAVWYWAHGQRSVDGFGVTLALVDNKPGPVVLFDPIDDLPGRFKLWKPSLLFYDQTDGPDAEWTLVGMGYHYPFEPCTRPNLDCVSPGDFRVHEAGYHHVPFGDGGMEIATAADLRDGVVLDPEACTPVYDEDLEHRLGQIRHGRSWVAHLWLDPDGGPPVVALTDPWERWADAPDRVRIEDEVFLEQTPTLCDCTDLREPPSSGCNG